MVNLLVCNPRALLAVPHSEALRVAMQYVERFVPYERHAVLHEILECQSVDMFNNVRDRLLEIEFGIRKYCTFPEPQFLMADGNYPIIISLLLALDLFEVNACSPVVLESALTAQRKYYRHLEANTVFVPRALHLLAWAHEHSVQVLPVCHPALHAEAVVSLDHAAPWHGKLQQPLRLTAEIPRYLAMCLGKATLPPASHPNGLTAHNLREMVKREYADLAASAFVATTERDVHMATEAGFSRVFYLRESAYPVPNGAERLFAINELPNALRA